MSISGFKDQSPLGMKYAYFLRYYWYSRALSHRISQQRPVLEQALCIILHADTHSCSPPLLDIFLPTARVRTGGIVLVTILRVWKEAC